MIVYISSFGTCIRIYKVYIILFIHMDVYFIGMYISLIDMCIWCIKIICIHVCICTFYWYMKDTRSFWIAKEALRDFFGYRYAKRVGIFWVDKF